MEQEAIPADSLHRLLSDPEGGIFRVEIHRKDPEDPEGSRLVREAHAHGLNGLWACRVERLCFLRTPLPLPDVERLSRLLLIDPILEEFRVLPLRDPSALPPPAGAPHHWIEVTWWPGVTDPAAGSLLQAARVAGLDVREAAWGLRFLLWGDLSEGDLHRLAVELCCNPVIQRYAIDGAVQPPFLEPSPRVGS